MKKHVIAAIGLDFEQNELIRALENVNQLKIEFFSAVVMKEKGQRIKALEFIRKQAEAVIVKDLSWEVDLDKFLRQLKEESAGIPLIPIGTEIIQMGIYNIDMESVQEINRYFIYGGIYNITNALRYIVHKLLENSDIGRVAKPEPVAFDGIFHPDAESAFTSLERYLSWYKTYFGCATHKGWIGLLINRNSWITGNMEVEKQLINELERRGFGLIPVFNYGSLEPELKIKDFDGIINSYFSCNGKLIIDALINLQIFILKSNNTGSNIFEHAADRMKKLNIPVFRPLISFMNTVEMWEESMNGLGMEIPWSFTVPEMQGMIEPVIIGCRDNKGRFRPIPDRISKFAARIEKWVELKNTPNNEKRLAVFLHNAPCSGVEATIGMGVGLDVFSSTVNLLKRLQREGWNIKNIPEDGSQLQTLIMERKAYSDFRWTAVEEIVKNGGCIYQMPIEGENGYSRIYEQFDSSSKKQIEETWGAPPGEGMVYNNHLIITGLDFGNVIVIVQPKRGCYGAKCTGEVCKILQDPQCPPPHQYIATYKYVEEVFKANACLHVGTHGSLEFLPGKTNAMSKRCYPDLVLGNLPNFYVYNAGVGTEGILAKRRTYAVILDHLPPIYMAQDTKVLQLVNLINEYFEAAGLKSDQANVLETQIKDKIAAMQWAGEVVDKARSFDKGLSDLKEIIIQSISNPKLEKRHTFGVEPSLEDVVWYIKEVIMSDVKSERELKGFWKDICTLHKILTEFIRQVIVSEDQGHFIAQKVCSEPWNDKFNNIFDRLSLEIREIYSKLRMTSLEMDNLIKALNGGFVPPGPSGMPDDNGRNIIPTGRNFYLMDIEKIPTKAAYEIGGKLAEELIALYIADEGNYPEKIAMNMISLDISRAKGEQFSQILYLMGITPVWDENGRVVGLETIPLKKLKRPRIDVTVRISGVLRDSYPAAIELIDNAVIMAAGLPEPESSNFVKKHTLQIASMLKGLGIEEQIERRSTIRIFGDRPGTYGAGVDLALKASAWKNETDLARFFIYFSSYAYGKSLNGNPVRHEFVENVKNSDISYDTTNSKRYDILASNFGASVQGGFSLIKKVLKGKEIKQYHGSTENPEKIKVTSLKEKMQETLDETLFNPLWKENVKEKGYHGAAEFMQRLQNVFEWQCLTGNFEDSVLDQLVKDYVNDPKMQKWFNENNSYAVEEIARRFLELYQRGKWQADPEVLEQLKYNYVKIEGDMEESLGDFTGEIQAGNIEIISDSDIKEWNDKLKEVNNLFGKGGQTIAGF